MFNLLIISLLYELLREHNHHPCYTLQERQLRQVLMKYESVVKDEAKPKA